MTNKKTNKNREKPTKLQYKWPNPSNDEVRNIMRTTWQKNHKCDDVSPSADVVTRITNSIHEKLSTAMQLPDYIGIQPMIAPTGLLYNLRYTQQPDNCDQMSLEIVSHAIEAKSRSLGIRIPFDVVTDGLEGEIVQAAAMEISRDFNEEFMDLMYQNSTYVDFRLDLEEDPDAIITKIMRACNDIARNSRRGVANKVVLPYELYAHILPYMSSKGWFTTTNNQTMSDLLHVGTLFDTQDVYVSIRNTVVLLGYKGGAGETDTGIFFCPHQINSHVSINPCTFEPSITMNTRHGRFVTENAKDYYISIQVR